MINLAGITQGAVNTVFEVAGQITILGTYTRVGGAADPTYDTDSGVVNEQVTDFANVRAMVLPFNAREVDGETVRTGDEKLLIRTSDLPGLEDPARDDRFVVGEVRRDVISFMKDPTNKFWILHCRRFSN